MNLPIPFTGTPSRGFPSTTGNEAGSIAFSRSIARAVTSAGVMTVIA